MLRDIIAEGSASPADWWNLGLVYKFQRRWQQALEAFVRNSELNPSSEAYWNIAVTATALQNWTMARSAWRRLEFDVGPGDGPPEADFGPSPVRLNPDTDGEVVWGVRVDPCRIRIKSVPLPGSGHRFDDIVLHDVVPNGTREFRGKTLGVFDEILRLDASPHPTLQSELVWARAEDEQELYEMFVNPALGAENWTSSVRMVCATCSVSRRHIHADAARPDELQLTGTWGFGGDESALRSILATWSAAGPGRAASELQIAEAR
jgi:hypothetical protein